jgi:hypothetical protein
MSWAILIVAGCYLGGSAVYTFSIARAHHRKATAGTNTQKLSDSWLVRIALALYIIFACSALVLSTWLGYGIYFSPKFALKVFALSFEQPRRGKFLSRLRLRLHLSDFLTYPLSTSMA